MKLKKHEVSKHYTYTKFKIWVIASNLNLTLYIAKSKNIIKIISKWGEDGARNSKINYKALKRS